MRIEFADRLKGLCICLVILGHSLIPDALLRGIYCFHMPAFFFINGFFFTKKTSVKKDARRLLVPYAVCALLVLAKDFIDAFRLDNFAMFLNRLKITFFVGPDSSFGIDHFSIGPIWFLIALFWSRQIFSFVLSKRFGPVVAIALGLAMTFVGDDDGIPFAIAQGVAGLAFIGAGYYFRKLYDSKVSLKWSWIFIALLAALGYVAPSLDMNYNMYPLFVVSAVCSLACTVGICKLLILVENKRNFVLNAVSFFGKISLLVFAVHHIEFSSFDWYGKLQFLPVDSIAFVRLAIDLIVAFIFYKISFVRNIFQLK